MVSLEAALPPSVLPPSVAEFKNTKAAAAAAVGEACGVCSKLLVDIERVGAVHCTVHTVDDHVMAEILAS